MLASPRLFLGVLLAAFLGGTTATSAAPTALIQIPTADVLGADEAFMDVAGAVREGGHSELSDWVFESGFGFGDGVEAGLDIPLNTLDDHAFFVKKMCGRSETFAWALGVNAIGFNGQSLNPYTVASKAGSRLRFHLGIDYAEPHWQVLSGADYPVGPKVTAMADWIGGEEGAWSAGVVITFDDPRPWELMTGLIHETETGEDLLYLNVGGPISLK